MATESGVQNPLVIDLVGREPQFGGFVLYMFETREWEPSPERLQELRAKVNSYLFYVTRGQFLEDHPECRENPLHFELRCLHRPDDITMEFIGGLQEALRPHGIKLEVSVSDVLTVGH